jgi:hypothetical protein
MRKAQELSMNLIVIGALSLTVLLIVGGILIFGPWDVLGSFTSSSDSSQQLLITKCNSKCNNLKYLATDVDNLASSDLKGFCCESLDINKDGQIQDNEICANAYKRCSLNGKPIDCVNDDSTGDGYSTSVACNE